MEFSTLLNINIASVLTILTGIMMVVIGALVYSKDTAKTSNIFFLTALINIGAWSVLSGVFHLLHEKDLTGIFELFLYIISGTIPLSVLFFALSLTREKMIMSAKQLMIIFVPYLLVVLVVFLNTYSTIGYGNFNTKSGIDMTRIIFIAYMTIYFLGGIYVFFKGFKESAGVFRKQLLYIFASISIAIAVGMTTNLLFFSLGIFEYFWVGHLIIFVTAIAVAYLMAKYNFWNIKLLATEFFIALLLLLLVGEIMFVRSYVDLVLKLAILLLVGGASMFLIRSIKHEIESKEEVEKLLADLEDANKELTVLDRRKSEFLSMSAKQLRDPLTAIKGYASMMLEGSFGKLEIGVHGAMQKIFESSKRLVVIIEDFMNISRIETGNMRFELSLFDLRKLIRELGEEMSINAKNSGLELLVDEPKEEYFVYADYGKIRQVISNLIDNAIKYTPKGHVALSIPFSDSNIVRIKISDTGIGMDQSTINKLFKKFSRAEGVSKVYTEGSGLGLYVAKEIIRNHKGKIWAESKGHGKGSSFFLELNRAKK